MAKYVAAFEVAGVTSLAALRQVTDARLKDSGVTLSGHRKRLLIGVAALGGGGAPPHAHPGLPARREARWLSQSRVTRAAICLQRHARRSPGSHPAVPAGHGLASQRQTGGLSRSWVTRAAICLQRHARRRPGSHQAVPVGHGVASQCGSSRSRVTRAAICLQQHPHRLAARSDRPFVLRLRRALMMVVLTPLLWLAWMLSVSRGVPFFGTRAMLGFPLLMMVALSIMAHLKLGPAWCRGAFLAKLGLRMSVIVHPMAVLVATVHQATSSSETIAENAIFFLQVSTGLAVTIGTLSGVLPASRGTRYFYIGVNTACLAVTYLRRWNHVDCGAVVLVTPPLLCALSGHLSHITVSAALRHTAEREEAMGDLRRMLDAKTAVKDTAAANLEWVHGPLTKIYKVAVLAGLVCHACDVATACWAHGCYAVDEPSVRCVRYVFAMLALIAVWSVLTYLPLNTAACRELYGTVALAHTIYATGHLAVALGVTQFPLDDCTPTAKCEHVLTGVPAPLEGPLGLFAVWKLHTLIRVLRNLALSFLATAQPTTELHRWLNVTLTIGCVVLSSEPDASSWADVRFITTIAYIYIL